jgi:hypothetical protein
MMNITSDARTVRNGWHVLLGVIPALLLGACAADPQGGLADQTAQSSDDLQAAPVSSALAARLSGQKLVIPAELAGQRAASPSIITGQKLLLVASNSGKCLDVTGGPGAVGNGILVQQFTCLPGHPTNQQWQFFDFDSNPSDVAFGTWQIKAVNSGKCLDVRDFSTADGARVQQWACGPNRPLNQRWFVAKVNGSDIFGTIFSANALVNAGKLMCLDVEGGEGATGDAVPVQQFTCLVHSNDGSPVTNQIWGKGTF